VDGRAASRSSERNYKVDESRSVQAHLGDDADPMAVRSGSGNLLRHPRRLVGDAVSLPKRRETRPPTWVARDKHPLNPGQLGKARGNPRCGVLAGHSFVRRRVSAQGQGPPQLLLDDPLHHLRASARALSGPANVQHGPELELALATSRNVRAGSPASHPRRDAAEPRWIAVERRAIDHLPHVLDHAVDAVAGTPRTTRGS